MAVPAESARAIRPDHCLPRRDAEYLRDESEASLGHICSLREMPSCCRPCCRAVKRLLLIPGAFIALSCGRKRDLTESQFNTTDCRRQCLKAHIEQKNSMLLRYFSAGDVPWHSTAACVLIYVLDYKLLRRHLRCPSSSLAQSVL